MLWIATTIFNLLSFLPEKIYEQISEHFANERKVEKEFMQIYTNIHFAPAIEMIDPYLNTLRHFFHREYRLLEKPEIVGFYNKWIKPRAIALEVGGNDGFWSDTRYKEQRRELLEDLDQIKSLI